MIYRLAVMLCLISFLPVPLASAHSVAFRLGRFAPRIDSSLWAENLETFTLDRGDFDALVGGVEVAFELNEYVDLAFGVESSSRTAFTSYRDFVRDDRTEIIQDLSLRTTPVTAGLRLLPMGKSHRVFPYVSGGAGLYFYEYREEGEFIDFSNFDIFNDSFVDRGLAYGAYLAGGIEARVSPMIFVFGEYRRHWARGTHDGDFRGFGSFELASHQGSFGVKLRF